MTYCTSPVLTIDGASASGKGTIAKKVARLLHFHYLDSGLLYRALAGFFLQHKIDLSDQLTIRQCTMDFLSDLTYEPWCLHGIPIDLPLLRSEKVGMIASQIAALAEVREQLVHWQRECRLPPGLVAEGRDMGTTIFPDAKLKIYLKASLDERAQRRFEQLIKNGEPANLATVKACILKRDEQDILRTSSPLKQASDAKVFDTTHLSIDAALQQILYWWHAVAPNLEGVV